MSVVNQLSDSRFSQVFRRCELNAYSQPPAPPLGSSLCQPGSSCAAAESSLLLCSRAARWLSFDHQSKQMPNQMISSSSSYSSIYYKYIKKHKSKKERKKERNKVKGHK